MMRRGAVFGAILLLAACSGAEWASPAGARADEYAVWSAAVNTLFGPQQPWVVVEGQTAGVFGLGPADVANLRTSSSLSRELLDEYVARNARPARVNASRISARGVKLVTGVWRVAQAVDPTAIDGTLTFSRVGFDRGGRRALVAVGYTCGAKCGRGTMLVMERGADRRWRPTSTVMSMRSGKSVERPSRRP
jgi:hypothetical protein